jgi:predicted DNA-binding transcriptional regulator AlpA
MALHPRPARAVDEDLDEDLAGIDAPHYEAGEAGLDEAEDYLHQLYTNLSYRDDDDHQHQARVRAARAEVRRLHRSAAKVKSAPASAARVRAPRARARRSAQAHGGSRSASAGSSDSDGGSGDPDSEPPPSASPASPPLPQNFVVQPLPHDRLWSVEDLAIYLGVSAQSVYTAIHRRQFPEKIPAPSLRVMSRARWRPEDVLAWVAERCSAHKEPVRESVPPAPGKRERGRPRLSDRRRAGGAK